jgi:hypothetical protein
MVYTPSVRAVEAGTDQLLPEVVAVSVCRGVPEAVEPAYTLTVIVGESPAAVPATPENVVVLWVVAEPFAGLTKVTSGAVVSIVKVLVALVPVLAAASLWLAWAV